MRATKSNQPEGVALVVTLVILVLLSVMAVGLLQTSGLDRGSSKSGADKAKADLIAQTAVNAASAQLADLLKSYPDSATSWEVINGNAGTVLYYRDQTPEQAINSTIAARTFVLPLASGGSAQTLAQKSDSIPILTDTGNTANAYNFNHARSASDLQGWIGSSPQWLGNAIPPTIPQPFRGQWVTISDSDNKAVGRYAYWMEDQSFKANANLMGSTVRGSNTLGNSPNQIPLQGILNTILPSRSDYDALAADLSAYRTKFPGGLFFNYQDLNQTPDNASTYDFSKLADLAKFEATTFSGAANLSRSGTKRVNLNSVISTSTDPVEIRKQLDEIIKGITTPLPNFSQRFYRTGTDKNSLDVPSTGTPSNRTIYLNKIAANIRDYIDTDSQPTVVNNDATQTVRVGPPPGGSTWTTPPTHALRVAGGSAATSGSNEVIAIGKERVPLIQEYTFRVRQIALTPRLGTFANYTISIDHYVEIWNSSTKDILISDLANPFLLIANQPGWDAGGLDDIPEGAGPPLRDLKLPLSSAKNASTGQALTVIPAGKAIVLTTDPTLLGTLTPDSTTVYQIAVPALPSPATYGTSGTTSDLRTYSGKTQKKSSSQLRINLKPRTTTATDYETEIAIGNDFGILESAWGAGALTSAMSINADLGPDDHFDTTKWHFLGASLKGNISATKPNATTGDPRTNAEQMTFNLNGTTANNDKTRYFDSGLDSSHIPGSSTLGAPNSNFVNPNLWIDYSSSNPTANNAPTVTANAALTSIGQLGDIFDPVRSIGDSNDVTLSRSGGRTLKVGQPEDLWDQDSTSASREWTSWRLADVFSTTSNLQLDGCININGINRDGGAALKAALFGYAFQASPDSDPQLSAMALSDASINGLLNEMKARLNNDPIAYSGRFKNTVGPFAERGELSEMPIFNSNPTDANPPPTTDDLVANVTTANTYDRGREELYRRIAELITTRGNVFTVYSVGQALVTPPGATTPTVTASTQLKVTFRIDPVWNAATPTDPYDPATSARFNRPDKYAIKILYAGD